MIEDLALNEIIASGPEIDPIPVVDAMSVAALSPISYAPAYATAISYLRALMACVELSPRSLALTEYIIALNPAHYTVWTFRLDVLRATEADMHAELDFLARLARTSGGKNYQLWHHRECIVRHLLLRDDQQRTALGIDAEKAFLAGMLQDDAKNYHVWSYRQWLCRDVPGFLVGEVAWTETMLRRDPYNNSAWNHRFFTHFEAGHDDDAAAAAAAGEGETELAFVQRMIDAAPDNCAAWTYYRGALAALHRTLASQRTFVAYHATDHLPAMEFMLAMYCSLASYDEAAQICLTLKARDTIRSKYWDYRASLIDAQRINDSNSSKKEE